MKITSNSLQWSLLKILSNLSLSIFLLLFIAFISTLGTIIEQDKPLQFYQQNYSEASSISKILSWKTIIFLGIDHLYSTWWFILLLIIFSMSLISCTISRQIPILRLARKWQFFTKPNQLSSLNLKLYAKNQKMNKINNILLFQKYYVFQRQNYGYAYKGLIGRVAPITVHISIILILIGAIIGKTEGFVVQEFVPQGETFHLQNIIKSGQFSYIPQDIIGKVEKFYITYNKDDSISNFFSDIYLFNSNNKQISHKVIFVNQPFRFNSLVIYQTDWDIIGIRIKFLNEKILQLSANSIFIDNNHFWITKISNPININQNFSLLISDLSGQIYVFDSQGKLDQIVQIQDNISMYSRSFSITDVICRTGLQIKSDPGIPIVYLGFAMLIVSTLLSYVSYSQFWFVQLNNQVYFGGNTNRALLNFEKEFIKIVKLIIKV